MGFEDFFDELIRRKIFLKILIFMLIIIGVFSSMYTVNTGEVAIISRLGEVIRVEEAGLHFKVPFMEKKTRMYTREQTMKFGTEIQNADDAPPITATTKDMQTIKIAITVSDTTTDPLKLYKAFLGNHVRSLMVPRIRDAVQTQIAKYSIEEFVSKRNELNQNIFKDLDETFSPYGLKLTNVSIVDYKFSEAYEQAVEEKKVLEQNVETERRKQEKMIIEAEGKVKLAELEIKRKEAEAKANKIETESLSNILMTKQIIEKWNGELPKVISSDANTMLSLDMFKPNIPQEEKKTE